MLKKLMIGIFVLVVLGAMFGSSDDSGDTSSTDTSTYADRAVADLEEAAEEESVAEEEPVEEAKPTKTAKPKPQFTSGQANAIAKAQDYLDYSAFSKKELIGQLEFNDFSTKDATFAVNHIKVNWRQQAVAKAKDYLSYSSFSKQELIDQLVFNEFTLAEATYGVNQAY